MRLIYRIFMSIVLGISLNIIVSYLLLPKLDRTLINRNLAGNYYNRDDIYRAIYYGLILSAIELMVVFLVIVIF